jgi:hypothetical protein
MIPLISTRTLVGAGCFLRVGHCFENVIEQFPLDYGRACIKGYGLDGSFILSLLQLSCGFLVVDCISGHSVPQLGLSLISPTHCPHSTSPFD